jgi:hypothetical protein
MANVINVIYPYKHEDMWVFDDEDVGLNKEPFVSGADTMIDHVLAKKGLQNPEAGFRLILFPKYDITFSEPIESNIVSGEFPTIVGATSLRLLPHLAYQPAVSTCIINRMTRYSTNKLTLGT